MKPIVLTIISALIFASVVLAEQGAIDGNDKLSAITIEDGISVEEAQILSSEYFWKYVSGCGSAGKPVDGGDYRISTAYIGYAGKPMKEKIVIEKRTGTISMEGRPTIVNPLKEWNVSP